MTDKVEEGLTAEEYKRAIDVQDACSLAGVVHDFSRVMTRVWVEARKEYGRGTDWVNTHPIAVMYSSKIASLTGSNDMSQFARAYKICRDKAGV